jgi:Clr5 domain
MVYDWEDKEDVCYRMYIEEKKSLEEIMEFMKTERNFAPRYCRLPETTSAFALPLPFARPGQTLTQISRVIVNALSRSSSSAGSFQASRIRLTRTHSLLAALRSYGNAIRASGRCCAS